MIVDFESLASQHDWKIGRIQIVYYPNVINFWVFPFTTPRNFNKRCRFDTLDTCGGRPNFHGRFLNEI